MLKTPLKVVHWIGYSVVLDAEDRQVATVHEEGHEARAQEIVRACNGHERMLEVLEFWLGAVQNSLSLRLALTGLPEGTGPVLVDMLQEAIALGEGEQS